MVSVVYHRPNAKGRAIFGGLEPYGKVWRSGANENTVFEVSRDVTIDGKPLPAGKYGFHTIPGKDRMDRYFQQGQRQGRQLFIHGKERRTACNGKAAGDTAAGNTLL